MSRLYDIAQDLLPRRMLPAPVNTEEAKSLSTPPLPTHGTEIQVAFLLAMPSPRNLDRGSSISFHSVDKHLNSPTELPELVVGVTRAPITYP